MIREQFSWCPSAGLNFRSMTLIRLTRQELYQQVWIDPMVRVAKRLGMSDRGLAKLCERIHIPTPPRGYWAKRAHDHPAGRPTLTGSPDEVIDFHLPDAPATVPPDYSTMPEYAREMSPEWRISVPVSLSLKEPLVLRAKVAMLNPRRSFTYEELRHLSFHKRSLESPGPGHLAIFVSTPQIPRALRLMQALIAALHARGYRIAIEGQSTAVYVLDERQEVALIERFTHHRRRDGTHAGNVPSGRLHLRVGGFGESGIKDEPQLRIEDQLNDFIKDLVASAMKSKDARHRENMRRSSWLLEDARRRKAEQAQRTEALRVETLLRAAEQMTAYQLLSDLLHQLESQSKSGASSEERVRAMAWIALGRAHLDQNHPVRQLLRTPMPVAPMQEAREMPWNWRG